MQIMILMAKQPIPGKTKTRLIPPLSEGEAADLYRAFLRDKIDQMKQVENVVHAIGFAPTSARPYFEALAAGFELFEQKGLDLSARLISVFDQAFEAGYTQVMAIDGDTPTLPPEYLRRGLAELAKAEVDMVLGPSQDGGYYAIGLKQRRPALFEVEMSTPQVAEDTLAKAEALNLMVHQLDPWRDIDRPADLAALRQSLRQGIQRNGFKAPATRRFLLRGAMSILEDDGSQQND